MNSDKNILIAEFCGFQKTNIGWYDAEEILNIKGSNTFDELLFDESFDWLIPVVILINTMDDFRFSTKILTMDVEIEDSHTLKIVAESSLDYNPVEILKSIYQCVVKFVEWYNKNSK